MATNDNRTTTIICAVGALRDEGAAEELMVIECCVIAAAFQFPVHCIAFFNACHRRQLFAILDFYGRRRWEESILLNSEIP